MNSSRNKTRRMLHNFLRKNSTMLTLELTKLATFPRITVLPKMTITWSQFSNSIRFQEKIRMVIPPSLIFWRRKRRLRQVRILSWNGTISQSRMPKNTWTNILIKLGRSSMWTSKVSSIQMRHTNLNVKSWALIVWPMVLIPNNWINKLLPHQASMTCSQASNCELWIHISYTWLN